MPLASALFLRRLTVRAARVVRLQKVLQLHIFIFIIHYFFHDISILNIMCLNWIMKKCYGWWHVNERGQIGFDKTTRRQLQNLDIFHDCNLCNYLHTKTIFDFWKLLQNIFLYCIWNTTMFRCTLAMASTFSTLSTSINQRSQILQIYSIFTYYTQKTYT